MKYSFLVLILFFYTAKSEAQENKVSSDASAEHKTLSNFITSFFDAVKNKDKAVMDNCLDDSFILISSDSNGEYLGKTKYVTGVMFPDLLTVTSFKLSEFNFIERGDVVIANFRSQWESTYKRKAWNANFLNTDIIAKTKDGYKIIYRHTSYPANQLKKIVEERYSN